MYNKQLDAFIQAAERGSFSKAANALFITPSSLIQQINLLEAHLGVCLFYRSARGVTLTPAGASIYEDAKNIIHLSEIAVERAKALEKRGQHTVRVGTSLFTKCKYLTDIWSRTAVVHPEIKIELVAQKAISVMTNEPLADIGKSYDLQEGIYIAGLYGEKCGFFELFPAKVCVAVPAGHRLFGKHIISLQDLRGETITLTKKGQTPTFDLVRGMLERENLCVQIVDTEFYDINVFATCELNNTLLLSLHVWSDIYPSMNTCFLDVDCTVPYGLVYPLHPTKEVQILLDTAHTLKEDGFFS